MQDKSKYVSIPQVDPNKIAVGDYVFACAWSDAYPSDPWAVGIVVGIEYGRVLLLGQNGRYFKRAIHITPELGKCIIKWYTNMQYLPVSPHTIHNAVWDQFDLDNMPAYCLNGEQELELKG